MSALRRLIDLNAYLALRTIEVMKEKALLELRGRIAFANRSAGQKRRQWRARRVARDWQVNRGEKA